MFSAMNQTQPIETGAPELHNQTYPVITQVCFLFQDLGTRGLGTRGLGASNSTPLLTLLVHV